MKLLKVLGTTTLVSGIVGLGTYVYNCAKWEEQERLFWVQSIVQRQNPQKYEELRNANCYDLDVWEKAEAELRDSIEQARRNESDSVRTYFEGMRRVKGCCK